MRISQNRSQSLRLNAGVHESKDSVIVIALEGFQLFNRHLYDANVAVIRAVVEKHGLTFIDWNRPGAALPAALFADATHTTDAGSAVFARRLYQALAPQLAAGARP